MDDNTRLQLEFINSMEYWLDLGFMDEADWSSLVGEAIPCKAPKPVFTTLASKIFKG